MHYFPHSKLHFSSMLPVCLYFHIEKKDKRFETTEVWSLVSLNYLQLWPPYKPLYRQEQCFHLQLGNQLRGTPRVNQWESRWNSHRHEENMWNTTQTVGYHQLNNFKPISQGCHSWVSYINLNKHRGSHMIYVPPPNLLDFKKYHVSCK